MSKLAEIAAFLGSRKKYWLIPLIMLFAIVAAVIFFAISPNLGLTSYAIY